MTHEPKRELLRCKTSPAYFTDNYCHIYDAVAKTWVPFKLWDAQYRTLATITDKRLTIILKARQLGLTWLVLSYALWLMLYRPAATVLLFSKRDDEATDLLDTRLKGIYQRLPEWMQARRVLKGSDHEWQLSNGSRALAFPTTGGRSYTATLAVVDEADFVPDLSALLNAVKPTIDAGGQMVLLSTVDKAKPESEFKRIYREAVGGSTKWTGVFLPWSAAPWRTKAWYASEKSDKLATTGSTDDLWQEYPATDTEALSARTLDKRIAPAWLEQCYRAQRPMHTLPPEAPAIPALEVYQVPVAGREYVIGADPAEGNPTSDDSALTVLDKASGEEVAALAGRFEPSTLAAYVDRIGQYYRDASVLVERNNHGHAALLWLKDNSSLTVLNGFDGKPGWHTTTRGKALLYDGAADAFRNGETVLHSFATHTQLASIEGSSLSAPEGQHDDRAMSYVLALQARLSEAAAVTVSENPFYGG
jgi:hypothetical protein